MINTQYQIENKCAGNVSSSNSHKDNVPKLRFSGYNEPYISVSLGKIATKVNRVDAKSTAPVMMISAASGFINQSEKYSHENAGESLKKYTLLKKGELSYNHGASKLREFGCCFELKVDEARIPYVYHSFSITEQFAPYIAILLNNPIMDKQLKRLVSSSVRMDGLLNISFDEYMSVGINIPSYNEQKKIYEFFTKLEQRIQKQQDLLTNLKSYKRGLLSLVFGDKIANSILSDILKKGKAGGTPQSSNSAYYNGEIPFLSIADMTEQGKYIYQTEKHISNEGLHNSTAWIVPCNSLILSMYASYGLVAVNKVPITTSQAMFAMTFKETVSVEYVYYYLSYLATTDYYTKMVSTGTQPNLNAEKVKAIPLYVPKLSEQENIVQLLQSYDNMLTKEEQLLVQLQLQKNAFLQQLFI